MTARARGLLVAAAVAALAGCGGAQRQDAASGWYARADVGPAPGRVPVRIESAGEPQQVGLRRESAPPPSAPPARVVPRVTLCITPCTVYVPPGAPVVVHTGGLGVRPFATRLLPATRGDRLRLRGPRERDATSANAAATGGVLLGLLGVIFLVAGPIELATGGPSGVATTILGGALLGAGIAFWVPGFLALRRLEPGMAQHERLTLGPTGLRVLF